MANYLSTLFAKAGLNVGTASGVGARDVYLSGGLKVGSPAVSPSAGDVRASGNMSYEGSMIPRRSSVDYTGYIYVPMGTPTTVYNSNTFSTVGTSTQITAATLGIPTAAKAVALRLNAKESAPSTANQYFAVGTSAYWHQVICYPQVANMMVANSGVVNCDTNGSIYYRALASGTNTLTESLMVFGYFI
jgi:hypothetical protein